MFVGKNVTYQMMMDWSSLSQWPLKHVILFISFWGSVANLSDDVIDHVTRITHSNSVFDYLVEAFGVSCHQILGAVVFWQQTLCLKNTGAEVHQFCFIHIYLQA